MKPKTGRSEGDCPAIDARGETDQLTPAPNAVAAVPFRNRLREARELIALTLAARYVLTIASPPEEGLARRERKYVNRRVTIQAEWRRHRRRSQREWVCSQPDQMFLRESPWITGVGCVS